MLKHSCKVLVEQEQSTLLREPHGREYRRARTRIQLAHGLSLIHYALSITVSQQVIKEGRVDFGLGCLLRRSNVEVIQQIVVD